MPCSVGSLSSPAGAGSTRKRSAPTNSPARPRRCPGWASFSPRTLILDGEVCAFDRNLVSQFHLLSDPDELATPPVFMAFDCLQLRDRNLRQHPLRERRKALEDVVSGADRFVYTARRLDDDGLAAWATVQARGYEGLIAKDERAPYSTTSPASTWFKVKVRHEGLFVVVGLAMADGWPYALLLAERDGERLVYRGRVEFGVGRRTVERVLERAKRRIIATCDGAERWRDLVWLEPIVEAEVSYSEIMQGRLRDAVLRAVPHS